MRTKPLSFPLSPVRCGAMSELLWAKESYWVNGLPVYRTRLVNEWTTVCPVCGEQKSNAQGRDITEESLSVVANDVGHKSNPRGCGVGQDRRRFCKQGLVQYDDLPPIRLADYRFTVPFMSSEESVATGVAKVLGQDLANAQGSFAMKTAQLQAMLSLKV